MPVVSLKIEQTRDDHIESGQIHASIHHLPPTQSNPSSHQGARDNLRHLAVCMGLRKFVPPDQVQRNHVIFYEDGGGWSPTYKAINETFSDPLCKKSFNSKHDFLEHWREYHNDYGIDNIGDYREFKDFIVLSGAGHHEMNLRKSILSSEVAFENFVKQSMMATGFTAQQSKYQSISNDNHK